MPFPVANLIGSTGNMPLIEQWLQCIAEYDRSVLFHLMSGAVHVGDAGTAFHLLGRLSHDELETA